MPTITAGSVATVYCPIAGTITITPGTSGRVSFQSRSISGGQSAAPQDIYSATTVSVNAGDTVSLEAINVDATYTTPAGTDTALSALVSKDGIPRNPSSSAAATSSTPPSAPDGRAAVRAPSTA